MNVNLITYKELGVQDTQFKDVKMINLDTCWINKP